jgi:septum formation topological specificity factor MinE
MMAGEDAFLKLNKDLVAVVLIYVEVKVARVRTKGEKKQEDRGRTGFM